MTQLRWYYAKVLAKTKNDNTNLETQLSNDPEGKQFLLLWRNTLSLHKNVFIFTQRMHKSTKRLSTKENVFKLHF